MKNKKIIIIVIGVILIIGLIGVISDLLTKGEDGTTNSVVCEEINKLLDSKKSFVVFIERQGSDPENNEFVVELKDRYKVTIVNVQRTSVKNKCLTDMVKEVGLLEDYNNEKENMLILYKKGEYVGSFLGIYNFETIEKYLDEKGLIEKPKPIDTVTFEKFKSNIKNKYVIILLTDDYHQLSAVKKGAKKHLPDGIKYDITNRKSKEGKKIFKYIDSNYKLGIEYPLALYFNNSKLMRQGPVWDEKYEYDALFK